jgi:hypothetical protein
MAICRIGTCPRRASNTFGNTANHGCVWAVRMRVESEVLSGLAPWYASTVAGWLRLARFGFP